MSATQQNQSHILPDFTSSQMQKAPHPILLCSMLPHVDIRVRMPNEAPQHTDSLEAQPKPKYTSLSKP